jgi:hypothetical protein
MSGYTRELDSPGVSVFSAARRLRRLDWCVAGLLFILVLVVYAPVNHYGFVDYDDYFYVAHNSHVLSGLNADSLRWAFHSTEFGNWFPLTWISLMADRQFFPSPDEALPTMIRADAHHRTNVWLHALSTALLFTLLMRMTGALGPSTVAAFLFGLHPVHVESVAWVAERKDVLSGLCWILTLHAYVRYVARPRAGTYVLTLLLYVVGFLAKPMVVTLPLVLRLLDVWPLRRIVIDETGLRTSRRRWMRIVVWEKIPFYALAAAMAMVTYLVQHQGGAVRTLQELPLGARLENAVTSTAAYLGSLLWPTRLAVFYPLASHPAWELLLALVVLGALTWLALYTLPAHPYLYTGWYWYLFTLLPVVGIVQIGLQARADRYTYIPAIGLSLMVAWGGAEVWQRWPKIRLVLGGLCCVAGAVSVGLTARQIPYWENSVTLFQRAIDVTGPNAIAHGYLGDVWRGQLMYEAAASEYRKGLAITPQNVGLLVDLADTLLHLGNTAEAIPPLMEAVRIEPQDPVIRHLLGGALNRQERWTEAVPQLEEAIRLKPAFAAAHLSLGIALDRTGRKSEAIAQLSEAIRLQPDSIPAQQALQIIRSEHPE